ncbi:Chemotaxis protein cheA [Roseomonas mucosa]|uniref:hybrid sensor histidine kinase/response regulator n=1 Tax=Roseomonas TaxID=125216 RepID=UPI000C17A568|nr:MULTISPECIES: response regulator [Roseomonas]ATR21713.1 hybrid sensor histidine kinase/response regulator [Roseomonas sp. FDAARGOS_362]UZO95862.1 Chemotaxis protein cheA [Roseomonas mucosa]
MSDFRQELLAAFAVEHREHLDAIRAALAAAEAGRPLDLRDIFRRAHSLKGAARAVDLPAVEELAHRLETLFSRLGEGRMPLDARAQAVAQQGLDAVETQVAAHLAAAPEEDGPPPPSAALAALDALLGAAAPDAPAEAHGAPPAAPRPGPAERPGEEGGEKEAAPAATPGTSTSGTSPPAPAERHPVAGGGEYLRVEAGRVDALSGLLHELSGELQNQDRQAEALRRLERRLRGLRRTWQELRGEAGKANGGGAEARLREFDLALSGLGRELAALVRDGRDAAWNADQLSRRLRQGVERISLVPAEAVLGGLGSMTRDLARSEGREIALRLEGMETEADRRVLQALKDPVLHLLRNAVGHGGEAPERRRALGKPERGEVGLRVELGGGRLRLRVFDDGAGPDPERIEAQAVRQGLLPARSTEAPPPAEDRLLALVFEPGFSTAEAVGRLSGRGMGLSVVAEAARALHGHALMRRRHPWGTEVVIDLPFSATRQNVLLLEAGGHPLALPTHGVERLLRLPEAALQWAEGHLATRIAWGGRDVMLPVTNLASLLGVSGARLPTEAGQLSAVLLRAGERRCLLAVEALSDVRTLPVSAVDAGAGGGWGLDPALVSGLVLPAGSLVPLLRPEGLMDRWLRGMGGTGEGHGAGGDAGGQAAGGRSDRLGLVPRPGAPAGEAEAGERASILVVDDSITTRTLEKSILEAQGYRVLLAVDGVEALNLLRGGEAVIDLVLADVEMPRMDGFGLLQAIKNDPRLAGLPVILMTSRADEADIRRGLELGAGAYLTKQKFDQRELLATIGQLL